MGGAGHEYTVHFVWSSPFSFSWELGVGGSVDVIGWNNLVPSDAKGRGLFLSTRPAYPAHYGVWLKVVCPGSHLVEPWQSFSW